MSARPLHAVFGDAAPRQIGKYAIEGVLGEGAMGIVYKATDPLIHRSVAVKTIRKPLLAEDAQDISAVERFHNEAKAAGRLTHPNIVSVYEYGEDGGDMFLAMEYVNGTPLQELIARKLRLPLPDVLSLMLQLLDALQCAHEQGVWHRDIKPANLLITPEGRLKVTDFGIARIDATALTLKTTTMGSPGYMAPERYTDETPDRRVDIFSCGVLLYELLTGAPPFTGPSNAVMYQVLHREAPAPSSLPIPNPPPTRYDAIVARALAKRAADRFATAQEMHDALVEATPAQIRPTISTQTIIKMVTPSASQDAPTQVVPRPSLPPQQAAPRPGTWDLASMERIVKCLTLHLGPVAPLVVKQAAQHCVDLPSLIYRVANETLGRNDRKAFLAEVRELLDTTAALPAAVARHAGHSVPPADQLPVLGDTPMRPDTVDKAQRVLTVHIGPIAKLLTQRAASSCSTREQFFATLADLAGEHVDRKALLAQLWRVA
jgi:eukaryotic-like serine/threonine-protein kinase